MFKKIILFFILLQSVSGCSQDFKKIIQGKWEMLQYDLGENNDDDEEISTGIIWVFNNNNICEERLDPSDPSKKVVYNYQITQENCKTNIISKELYYLILTNKTTEGNDFCFLLSKMSPIDNLDKSIRLSLFTHGAISPNVLVKK